MQAEHQISRRGFLKTLTMAGTAVALLPLVASSAQSAYAADMPFVPVGKTEDFTEGDFKKVALPDGLSVYVTKRGKDYLAYTAKCTHRGCEVLWVPSSDGFKCPCHGARFDSSGNVTQGPAQNPLPKLPTKVDGGKVCVQG